MDEVEEKMFVDAIELVADDGIAQAEQGGADLVEASGFGFGADQAEAVAGLFQAEGGFGPVERLRIESFRDDAFVREEAPFFADLAFGVGSEPAESLDASGEDPFD